MAFEQDRRGMSQKAEQKKYRIIKVQNCGLKKFQVVSMLYDVVVCPSLNLGDQKTMTYNDCRCDLAASRTDRGSSCSLWRRSQGRLDCS